MAPYQGVQDCYQRGRCSRERSYIYVFRPVHRQLIYRGLYRFLRPGHGATPALSWGSRPDIKNPCRQRVKSKKGREIAFKFNSTQVDFVVFQ